MLLSNPRLNLNNWSVFAWYYTMMFVDQNFMSKGKDSQGPREQLKFIGWLIWFNCLMAKLTLFSHVHPHLLEVRHVLPYFLQVTLVLPVNPHESNVGHVLARPLCSSNLINTYQKYAVFYQTDPYLPKLKWFLNSCTANLANKRVHSGNTVLFSIDGPGKEVRRSLGLERARFPIFFIA